ncbi:hypothetical protein EYF80_035475 [Liparis tanakae]|uniref:Uncharacterized protein n=1 Tax=Liparis tanakae TaxID=230148 RepID=A0A4Z2GM92_9TELE|nr:hypothetical protein EYF80_035475 [Liparis tanakae]
MQRHGGCAWLSGETGAREREERENERTEKRRKRREADMRSSASLPLNARLIATELGLGVPPTFLSSAAINNVATYSSQGGASQGEAAGLDIQQPPPQAPLIHSPVRKPDEEVAKKSTEGGKLDLALLGGVLGEEAVGALTWSLLFNLGRWGYFGHGWS